MEKGSKTKILEVLAPARDAATAIAAINHGADAIYIGSPAFGARAAAANSLDDIRKVVEAAHPFGVKVYVTLNTIIYEEELDQARQLIFDLWQIGVDALIVQDMALLEMDIPPIDLHASTQCDARTPKKIAWLSKAGFSQIVLPREFTLEEIREASQAAPSATLEAFVHGALCVSYSGDCHAGILLAGRSANRGECPQVCRLEFSLTDRAGRPINPPDGGSPVRHWLSLADMNRIENLASLVEAGVTSFKIEGRLKSESYVKNVTLAYSNAVNQLIAQSDGSLRRSSFGRVEAAFIPDVSRSFNRGFTPYFLNGVPKKGLTSWRTPKWMGRPVAEVIEAREGRIKVRPFEDINNGDGLVFFDSTGAFKGFRVNRAAGQMLYPAISNDTLALKRGTILYRNSDAAWESAINRPDTARRTIGISFTLRTLPDGRIAADAADERGCSITVVSSETFSDSARSPQEAQRKSIFERLGDTIYRLESYIDKVGNLFIPAKELTSLRRLAIDAIESDWRIRRHQILRRPSALEPSELEGITTSYHDNVANPLAERFYKKHGAHIGELAAEVEKPRGETRVMTTRYCLRRELGCCLKGPKAAMLPKDLYLNAPIGRLRLDFDCAACRMNVMKT